MAGEPTTNGHDAKGRFVVGNPGGPGNPLGGQAARLRNAALQAITPMDIQVIVARLIGMRVAATSRP